MVLSMEGDLGISLILGWLFLRDARAIIDVGTGRISLLIMGKNMKFKFQNKRQELFLIHEDDKKEGLYDEPGWKDCEVHEPPTEPAWEEWEIHELQQNKIGRKGGSVNLQHN